MGKPLTPPIQVPTLEPEPPTIADVMGTGEPRPVSADVTTVRPGPSPHPEVRALPEAGGIKRFVQAVGPAFRERVLMDQRPVETVRRKQERERVKAEVGVYAPEPEDFEVDLATQLGDMLGGLLDPTILLPFVGGEKVAFAALQAAAKRGLPVAKKFVELARAPATATVAQRALSSAVRSLGTAGTGAVAAEATQKLGREGEVIGAGEAAAAFAVGTIAIPPIAATVGALGGALSRLYRSATTGRAVAAPKDIVNMAKSARAAEQIAQDGRLTPEQELDFARQIIGVGEEATERDITVAWRQRVQSFHPDVAGDTETTKIMNAARDLLRENARGRAPEAPAPEPAAEAPARPEPEAPVEGRAAERAPEPVTEPQTADLLETQRAAREQARETLDQIFPEAPAVSQAPVQELPAALETLAQQAERALMPGQGDRIDQQVVDAEMGKLEPAARELVQQRIKELQAQRDPLTGGRPVAQEEPTVIAPVEAELVSPTPISRETPAPGITRVPVEGTPQEVTQVVQEGLSVGEVTRSPVELTDALKMTSDDLQSAAELETQYEKQDTVAVFGAEEAAKYERAQRIVNSSTVDPNSERYKTAEQLISDLEDNLTQEQQTRLFGFGETGMNAEDLRGLANTARQYADIQTETDDALVQSFSTLMAGERSVDDPNTQYALQAVYGELTRRGVTPDDELVTAVLSRMGEKGIETSTAAEALQGRMEQLRSAVEPVSTEAAPTLTAAATTERLEAAPTEPVESTTPIEPESVAPTEEIRPGATAESGETSPKIVSLKKEEGAEIRERLGLEELEPLARQSFQEAWDEASSRELAGQAIDVAQEAMASRRPMTTTEHAGAVQRYLELERELRDARSTLAEATQAGNDEVVRQLSVRSQRILDEIDALTEATDRAGTEAGRALSIRRLRANVETFALATGLQLARGRKGAPLTPQEISEIEQLTGQIATLEEQNTELRTENDELLQKRQQTIAEQVAQIEAKRGRVSKGAEGAATRLQSERQDLLKQLNGLGYRLNDISGVSAEGLYLIGRLAINHIREQAATTGEKITLDRIVKDVLAELNNPEIQARDVYEALNARDPKRQRQRRDEVTRQVRQLKSQAQLLVEIEDAEAGIFDPQRRRAEQSVEVRALQKRLTDLRNHAYRAGLDAERLERSVATINELQDQLANHYRNLKRRREVGEINPELAAMRENIRGLRQEMRVEDTLADLEEQLRTGDLRIPERRAAPYTSPQLERNQIALQRAQRRWRDAIERMAPLTTRRVIAEATGFLRAMKATADMSGTLRQGFWLSARRPITATKAFAKAVKAFFSEYNADEIDNAIRQHPHQLLRDKAGLTLTERGGKLSDREEYFASSVAERIPVIGAVVRASERSMATTLNLLRVAAFDQFVEQYPNATTDELKAWANWVNVATGRGDLGRMTPMANELALVFFAPRFAVSRIQTPFMAFKHWQQPRVRKEIAKDYSAVAAVGLTALGLGALAGLSVGLDPRDPDFGKIRIGDTHIDIWAGVQQPARLLARIMLGLTDRTGLTGKHLTKAEKDVDPLELLGRFTAFKVSPAITIPRELYRGKTAVGEETTPGETAVRSVLPMVFEDVYEAHQSAGIPRAVLVGGSVFLGVGAQTYKDSENAVRRDLGRMIQEGKRSEAAARARKWNAANPENPIRSVRDVQLTPPSRRRRRAPTQPIRR